MSDTLTLGYSPCPNDTFIFHALASGLVDWPGGLSVTLADVEELNAMAGSGALDVVKVSVAAAAGILDDYVLLRAGGAMGYGVGPILVAGEQRSLESLDGGKVAIPGRRTTANLLFGMCCREAGITVDTVEMVFDQVMPAVEAGAAGAGVVIHEGRFTFGESGLVRILDLGAWWEAYTGLPLPLGAIAVKRSLGEDVARSMNKAIRQSLLAARANPGLGREYVRKHAQEMDEAVIRRHIETFVTDYSLDVGDAGVEAVMGLLSEAGCTRKDIFITL
ncbi:MULTISPECIES: 1,4-dihydroxy-6-naphthoate synthase [unclassified Pseudodesulfovibrio]|uniref:1,4-dihydroxy-6-naphthoate synthase n=1 Tax=unclassified Pseudodesulfovibrio TaxID=2661612 RepID=UPI000FEBA35A|nr:MULTISPECIES: 1,4-dihydroxy-6-naphthoate synthase [unclassified Pseudodesulfovibrio]MCJ2163087.1 1,4-dihydroxy-6-naphthoate synthase [Pseudodesulfovibrio sp. S3-i]RWU07080.1 1,4-dihydroxy-6-naphthoate synthase [Pseudodesulfovibrio sp. S3]